MIDWGQLGSFVWDLSAVAVIMLVLESWEDLLIHISGTWVERIISWGWSNWGALASHSVSMLPLLMICSGLPTWLFMNSRAHVLRKRARQKPDCLFDITSKVTHYLLHLLFFSSLTSFKRKGKQLSLLIVEWQVSGKARNVRLEILLYFCKI